MLKMLSWIKDESSWMSEPMATIWSNSSAHFYRLMFQERRFQSYSNLVKLCVQQNKTYTIVNDCEWLTIRSLKSWYQPHCYTYFVRFGWWAVFWQNLNFSEFHHRVMKIRRICAFLNVFMPMMESTAMRCNAHLFRFCFKRDAHFWKMEISPEYILCMESDWKK